MTTGFDWRAATRHRLFWPLAMLVALLLINVPFTPGFFAVNVRAGHLYGSLIDILIFSAPIVLVALGMTLVIATGGIDLSVGAVLAISGAAGCLYVSKESNQNSVTGVLIAVALGLGAGLVCGAWNGWLVAGRGVQPIVATLILMVAGRGVAQLITNGQIITVNSSAYSIIGGYWLGFPFPILVVAAMVAAAVALTRRTALGLLIESVGGNAEASRLVGIRSRRIKLMAYMFCGLCAALAGLINSSNLSSADGNNAGLWIELDAILAAVIGGTSLLGGRFYLGGTVIGALIIETLQTTIFTIGVPTQTNLVFKAVMVIFVFLLQSPAFRAKVFRRRGGPPSADPASTALPATVTITSTTTTSEVGG
jgi:ribose/xylose/arabinose/galactoside ABC-type transport system permease subunit